MLIQVLQANKQALISESGWDADWKPFAAEYPEVRTPVRIARIQLASVDPAETFIEIQAPGDSGPAALASSIGAGEHPESAGALLRAIQAPPA